VHITVDGGTYDAASGLKNWGELLVALERGEGEGRRVVTAVRFHGVDQPSFREGSALACTLADVAPIDIETATVSELIDASALALRDGVTALASFAHEPARAFRLHDIARAQSLLTELIGTFKTMTALASVVIDARRSTLSHGNAIADSERALEPLRTALESLIDATARKDWITAADVLDSQISADLPRWLEAVCAQAS